MNSVMISIEVTSCRKCPLSRGAMERGLRCTKITDPVKMYVPLNVISVNCPYGDKHE